MSTKEETDWSGKEELEEVEEGGMIAESARGAYTRSTRSNPNWSSAWSNCSRTLPFHEKIQSQRHVMQTKHRTRTTYVATTISFKRLRKTALRRIVHRARTEPHFATLIEHFNEIKEITAETNRIMAATKQEWVSMMEDLQSKSEAWMVQSLALQDIADRLSRN